LKNRISAEGPDLEDEISNDSEIVALCADYDIAKQFYAGMCSITWKKLRDIPEDELIMETLKGNEYHHYLCSWRHAGSIIARIRNANLGVDEIYTDFYCTGNEGYASKIVIDNFKRLGWTTDESEIR
jgi:hypothetical protein